MRVEFKDRIVEYPSRYTMTQNIDGTVTLTPAPGTIVEPGTPLNAKNLNTLADKESLIKLIQSKGQPNGIASLDDKGMIDKRNLSTLDIIYAKQGSSGVREIKLTNIDLTKYKRLIILGRGYVRFEDSNVQLIVGNKTLLTVSGQNFYSFEYSLYKDGYIKKQYEEGYLSTPYPGYKIAPTLEKDASITDLFANNNVTIYLGGESLYAYVENLVVLGEN